MLHNSSSEEEAPISRILDGERNLEDDIGIEFNQADFDLHDGSYKAAPTAALNAKVAQQFIDSRNWPPTTYSASSGIFIVTPRDHNLLDPHFKVHSSSDGNSKSAIDHSTAPHISASRGVFEASYPGEPPAFIQYRMDAFASAWDLCLQRCTKVVEAHFKLAIIELCRFIRQSHSCWSWPINIIPTAVFVLGVDISDYPIFFGVLKRHLKRGHRRIAFLDPNTCTSMSKLMDSLFKQVIPLEHKASHRNMASLQRYVEEIRENTTSSFSDFKLTIVVQSVEHWANNNVLADFLEMISHYASFLGLTMVLQVSSGRDQLTAALPASTLQLMTSKTFYITSSSSAIDLVLKHTILAKDAPFKPSQKFLKWILENLKFLNHSISSLVTKLKIVYWRFFYTQPLSWFTGSEGPGLLHSILASSNRNAIIEPFERLIESYFSRNNASIEVMMDHKLVLLLKDIHSKVANAKTNPTVQPPKKRGHHTSKTAYQSDPDTSLDDLQNTLVKWSSALRRSMLLKATALELFVALKHLAISSESDGHLSAMHNGKIDMEDQLVQVQGMRDIAEMSIGRRRIAKDFNLGLTAEHDLEIHDWYGCPNAYEYYALLTNTRQVVHAALGHIRGDEKKLRNVLKHWLVIIERLSYHRDSQRLFMVLKAIFEEDLVWLEEDKDEELSEEEIDAQTAESIPPSKNHSSLMDKLLKKMEDLIVSAFEDRKSVV